MIFAGIFLPVGVSLAIATFYDLKDESRIRNGYSLRRLTR